jgi:hypothetical protein
MIRIIMDSYWSYDDNYNGWQLDDNDLIVLCVCLCLSVCVVCVSMCASLSLSLSPSLSLSLSVVPKSLQQTDRLSRLYSDNNNNMTI